MYGKIKNQLSKELSEIESKGLFKKERVITTSQGATVKVSDDGELTLYFGYILMTRGSTISL